MHSRKRNFSNPFCVFLFSCPLIDHPSSFLLLVYLNPFSNRDEPYVYFFVTKYLISAFLRFYLVFLQRTTLYFLLFFFFWDENVLPCIWGFLGFSTCHPLFVRCGSLHLCLPCGISYELSFLLYLFFCHTIIYEYHVSWIPSSMDHSFYLVFVCFFLAFVGQDSSQGCITIARWTKLKGQNNPVFMCCRLISLRQVLYEMSAILDLGALVWLRASIVLVINLKKIMWRLAKWLDTCFSGRCWTCDYLFKGQSPYISFFLSVCWFA